MKFLLILTLVGCALGTVSAGDNGEVCVIDGVTYNAGDEIPNNDPCATCTCVPGAADQQICAVVACALPICGACGLKTSPDVCCPFCTPECNISNLSNVTYCEGDPVETDNQCETCSCAPDLPGQKVCLTTPCFSITDCGGFPMVTPPGECCPKCPTCDVVGPGYQPGDKLPIGDPCTLSCVCDSEGRTACAPVFQPCPLVDCPFGTKAVIENTPGQCCPNITCVPIDSCEVNGTEYAFGDPVPSDDPCRVGCTCRPPGLVLCAVIDCARPVCGDCGLKTSPNLCCPFCAPECNISNVTYCEGDPVETDNQCETCSCAPDLPGQKVCLTTPCFSITDCGGFPMVTPPGECCPKCPTCDVVGPGYQPGDKLPIGDPCTLSCVCDSEGRTACAPVFQPCPLVDCPFGTKAVIENTPGQCCPNITCVPIDSCEVNGTEYAFGDPVPSDDPCRVGCTCRPPGLVLCAIVDCFNFECPDGQRLKYLPDQCCPICVPEYPDCSFRLCKRKKNALCTIPDAAGKCTCKVSSCKAAYYSMDERPPPPRCTRRNKCAGLTGDPLEKCLKKWGNCVKNAFRAQHGKTQDSQRKSAFFKSLEYPCGD